MRGQSSRLTARPFGNETEKSTKVRLERESCTFCIHKFHQILGSFLGACETVSKESTQRTKTAKGVDQLCQHLTCLGERGKCCSKLQSLGNFSHFSSLPKLYLLLQKSRKRTRRETLNKVFLKICLSTLHCLAY